MRTGGNQSINQSINQPNNLNNMARNTMRDLQNHLFETIEMLKAKNDPNASENEKLDLPTAKAICHAATVIIESAKAENEYLNIIARASNPSAVAAQGATLMLGNSKSQKQE